jgi:hypothetical protein
MTQGNYKSLNWNRGLKRIWVLFYLGWVIWWLGWVAVEFKFDLQKFSREIFLDGLFLVFLFSVFVFLTPVIIAAIFMFVQFISRWVIKGFTDDLAGKD